MSRFWKDIATISRQQNVDLGNGFSENELNYVYVEIPCHLSISKNSMSNVVDSMQATTVDYYFKLFCAPDVVIYPNDVLEIETRIGKKYKFYAGVSMNYDKTCQTALSFTPTANEVQ